MKAPQYAVLSVQNDGHIPFVQKHLKSELLLIDPTAVMRDVPLAYSSGSQESSVRYNGVDLSSLRAIWYRKPEWAWADGMAASEVAAYTRHAVSRFFRLLYDALPETRWVSDFYAMFRAGDKLRQLTVARQLGFNVPDTLITSSVEEARAFIRHHDQVIVKPIEVKLFTLDGKQRAMMAQYVTEEGPDLSGLPLAPAIFQQAIDAACDMRVTVVGKQVFAASIVANMPEKASPRTRDWRVADQGGSKEITQLTLPPKLAQLCVRHVQRMGLQWGAIDLVLDRQGTFWFLENNPNGQWAFVEEQTGQPIGKAFARLLTGDAQ